MLLTGVHVMGMSHGRVSWAYVPYGCTEWLPKVFAAGPELSPLPPQPPQPLVEVVLQFYPGVPTPSPKRGGAGSTRQWA